MTKKIQIQKILPAAESRRTFPENLRKGDETLFSSELTRNHGEAYSWTMEGAAVTDNGMIFPPSSWIPARESFSADTPVDWKKILRGISRRLAARNKTFLESAVLLTDQFSNGYFHWMLEVLPKLELLEGAVPGDWEFLVPAMADFPYVKGSLEPYILPRLKIMGKKEECRINRLTGISSLAVPGNYREELMERVRTRFRNWAEPRQTGRKIYISRAKAKWRRIENEAETADFLRDRGFEILNFEDLDFRSQVRTAAEASVMVSIHGAGLTNMLFMPAGSKVLETRRQGDGENNCYFSLANALGHRYWYLQGRASSEDTHTADLTADLGELKEAVESLLEGQTSYLGKI